MAFKEAMKKELENEQMNRMRKWTGIEVYSELNRNRWNEQGDTAVRRIRWLQKNVGCNERISALGVRVIGYRITGSVSIITCIEHEQVLIILSERMR